MVTMDNMDNIYDFWSHQCLHRLFHICANLLQYDMCSEGGCLQFPCWNVFHQELWVIYKDNIHMGGYRYRSKQHFILVFIPLCSYTNKGIVLYSKLSQTVSVSFSFIQIFLGFTFISRHADLRISLSFCWRQTHRGSKIGFIWVLCG